MDIINHIKYLLSRITSVLFISNLCLTSSSIFDDLSLFQNTPGLQITNLNQEFKKASTENIYQSRFILLYRSLM
jgi:hypothetical protein